MWEKIQNWIEIKDDNTYSFVYGDMWMEIKIEPPSDKLSVKKTLTNNLLVYVESTYHDGEYSYNPQVFLEKCTFEVK